MKRRYIQFLLATLIILIVAGFFVLSFHYKGSTLDQEYGTLFGKYEEDEASYQEYLNEHRQYGIELSKYNAAVEADKNKEEVPEDGIIKVNVDYSISNEENSVGNEWDYVIEVNGNQINEPSTEININAHDPLTIYVKATENDDAVSDMGTAEETIHYTNEEIIGGLSKQINVSVREDAGRYTDNVANITVSLNFKRVIEQVIIPDEPTEPKAVTAPVEPVKADITVNVVDIIKYNKVVMIYAIVGTGIIISSIIVMMTLRKKKA